MTEHDTTRLKEEILIFLSGLPAEIQKEGNAALPRLTIQIGNILRIISFKLDPKQPEVYQPLHQPAQSIYALAEQFREVGVDLWQKKPRDAWAAQILASLELVQTRMANLEAKLITSTPNRCGRGKAVVE